MKCGSCGNKDAHSYTRVLPDHVLFPTLKTLNTKNAYDFKHSLYCEWCITLAEAKLSNKSTATAHTSAIINLSISNNNSAESDGSMDSRKRLGDSRNRPCPKRHKKPSAKPEMAISQQPPVSSRSNSDSSQSTLERSVLMNEMAEADSSVDEENTSQNSNNLQMVDDAVDEQSRKTTEKPVPDCSISLSGKHQPNKRQSTTRHGKDSDVSRKTVSNKEKSDQEALPGLCAPAVSNPRIRDLRNYFSAGNLPVDNYARTLGG